MCDGVAPALLGTWLALRRQSVEQTAGIALGAVPGPPWLTCAIIEWHTAGADPELALLCVGFTVGVVAALWAWRQLTRNAQATLARP